MDVYVVWATILAACVGFWAIVIAFVIGALS